MSQLKIGETIRGFKSAYTITDLISDRGGQGYVYKAKDSNNKECAVKWYKQDGNVEENTIQRNRISDLYRDAYKILPILKSDKCKFLWPLDFIKSDETYGYIMELATCKSKFSDLLYNSAMLASTDLKSLAELSINLCSGFDKLHSIGYCYKDISFGNILFDEKSHCVEILDCDNVRVNNNDKSNVIGTEGFIAPEILRRKSAPNKLTDRFSLSSILFCIWCKHKPFEGTAYLYCDTNEERNEYCKNPVFIFNPADESNTAINDPPYNWAKGIFNAVRYWWYALPSILRDRFSYSFINALNEPDNRLTSAAWKEIFETIINEDKNKPVYIEKCSHCRKHIAVESDYCVFCGKPHNAKTVKSLPSKIKTAPPVQSPPPTVRVITHKTNSLDFYDGDKQIKTIDVKEGLIISGAEISEKLAKLPQLLKIVSNPKTPQELGIMNLSIYNLTMYSKDGSQRGILNSNTAVPIGNISKIILPNNIILYAY